MDLALLKEWIIPVSSGIALLSIAVSVCLGTRGWCRKLRAEEQLAQAARAETNVRLVGAFTDLVLLAGGTGRYGISGEVVRAMLDSGVIGEDDFNVDQPTALHTKIARLAMMATTGGGPTAQTFAIYGVGALAARHELLRELGVKALEMERIRETAPDKVRELLEVLRRPT
jgi:hypothetical protein